MSSKNSIVAASATMDAPTTAAPRWQCRIGRAAPSARCGPIGENSRHPHTAISHPRQRQGPVAAGCGSACWAPLGQLGIDKAGACISITDMASHIARSSRRLASQLQQFSRGVASMSTFSSARPGEPTPPTSDAHRGPTGVLEVRKRSARSVDWRHSGGRLAERQRRLQAAPCTPSARAIWRDPWVAQYAPLHQPPHAAATSAAATEPPPHPSFLLLTPADPPALPDGPWPC